MLNYRWFQGLIDHTFAFCYKSLTSMQLGDRCKVQIFNIFLQGEIHPFSLLVSVIRISTILFSTCYCIVSARLIRLKHREKQWKVALDIGFRSSLSLVVMVYVLQSWVPRPRQYHLEISMGLKFRLFAFYSGGARGIFWFLLSNSCLVHVSMLG